MNVDMAKNVIKQVQSENKITWAGFIIYKQLRERGYSRSTAVKALKSAGYACFKLYDDFYDAVMLEISDTPLPLLKRWRVQLMKDLTDTAGTFWDDEQTNKWLDPQLLEK